MFEFECLYLYSVGHVYICIYIDICVCADDCISLRTDGVAPYEFVLNADGHGPPTMKQRHAVVGLTIAGRGLVGSPTVVDRSEVSNICCQLRLVKGLDNSQH